METASRKDDSAARRRTLEYAGLLNRLKTCVRSHMATWFHGLVKRCMDPSANLDLQRNDLQLRMEAMDMLFASRDGMADGYEKSCLQRLELRTDPKSAVVAEPGPEDAQTADAGWRFITRADHRHQPALTGLARGIDALAECMGRPLDPYGLHPRALYEAFRVQARALSLPVAGQIILCGLYIEHLEAGLEKLYREANQALIHEKLKLPIRDGMPAKRKDDRLYEAIGAISALFIGIERHADLSDAARRSLLGLKPAMTLLAYSDPPAFESGEHPAKQRVTSLALRWQGLHDINDPRHQSLVAEVERLASGSRPIDASSAHG
jgi:hypothetical protein